MKKAGFIFFSLFIGLFIFSCKKPSNPEPGPPVISFMDFNILSFEPKPDAIFHFKFTDPDGDIGLKDGDTTGAFAFGSEYYNDFHMEIYKFDTVTQTYIPGILVYLLNGKLDTFGLYNYRIPFVTNTSIDKSLTGEVKIELFGFRPSATMKRFRYQFYIYDRAHHKSNVITTPEFNYP